MRKCALIVFLALLALPVHAEPPRWAMDVAQSKLTFSAQQGSDIFNGGFKDFTAEIIFDPDDLEHSRIAATIAMASAFAGSNDRDQALPGATWFDVKSFPQAQFVTKTIRKTGAQDYMAQATLTIRGISKDVQLPFSLTPGADPGQMRAVGAVVISRHDFGVGQGEFANDSWIKYEVKVGIDILAVKNK